MKVSTGAASVMGSSANNAAWRSRSALSTSTLSALAVASTLVSTLAVKGLAKLTLEKLVDCLIHWARALLATEERLEL